MSQRARVARSVASSATTNMRGLVMLALESRRPKRIQPTGQPRYLSGIERAKSIPAAVPNSTKCVRPSEKADRPRAATDENRKVSIGRRASATYAAPSRWLGRIRRHKAAIGHQLLLGAADLDLVAAVGPI